MTLTENIQQAIAQSLPAAVAGELKEFLAQADENKKQLERVTDERDRLQRIVKELEARLQNQDVLAQREEEVKARTKELDDREYQLRLSTAENRALVAEAKTETVLKMADLVFRNTEVRRTAFGSAPVVLPGSAPNQYNSYGTPATIGHGNTNESTTETQS